MWKAEYVGANQHYCFFSFQGLLACLLYTANLSVFLPHGKIIICKKKTLAPSNKSLKSAFLLKPVYLLEALPGHF